jgi:pilus assembly protein CpaB
MSVVAFLLVIILGTVVAGRSAIGTAKMTVVVAAQDIGRRTVIGPAELTTQALPVSAVPPSAIGAPSEAVGKVTQVTVLKGQPITTNLIADEGAGDPAYLPIPQGWQAFTLPANELQAVAGYISPGDVIDIQASVSTSAFSPNVSNPPQVTRTVFQGVHIIKVGPATNQGVKGGQILGVTTSLTVLITPCDAPYMTWLLANTSIRYALESSKDYASAPTAPSASCPVGSRPPRVGPAEVDSKFGFTKA